MARLVTPLLIPLLRFPGEPLRAGPPAKPRSRTPQANVHAALATAPPPENILAARISLGICSSPSARSVLVGPDVARQPLIYSCLLLEQACHPSTFPAFPIADCLFPIALFAGLFFAIFAPFAFNPFSPSAFLCGLGVLCGLFAFALVASHVEILRLRMVDDDRRCRLLRIDLLVLGEDTADALGFQEAEQLALVGHVRARGIPE